MCKWDPGLWAGPQTELEELLIGIVLVAGCGVPRVYSAHMYGCIQTVGVTHCCINETDASLCICQYYPFGHMKPAFLNPALG